MPQYKIKPEVPFRAFLLLFILLNIWNARTLTGQTSKDAFDILDKAIGFMAETDQVGIYFEGIAYDVKNPSDFFRLPAYKMYRGGYWFIDQTKFEFQLGNLKGISDGKIFTVINQDDKLMYIDSIRAAQPGADGKIPDITTYLDKDLEDATFSYAGTEMVNKQLCHKIRSDVKGEVNTHIFYWVTVKTNKLYLMAEHQGDGYTIYWFNKIGPAPKNYNYAIHLPNRELNALFGLQVIDMRFAPAVGREPKGM
jgi:hypothetical protein